MASSKKHQMNILAIIVLIVSVLVMVFLSINAVYFYGLMNGTQPTGGESIFSFATSIVLTLIFLGIAIYCLVKIFKHKAVIYPDEPVKPEIPKPEIQTPVVKPIQQIKEPLPDIPAVKAPPLPKSDITKELESKVSNSPPTISPQYQDPSMIVATPKQQDALEKLIAFGQASMD